MHYLLVFETANPATTSTNTGGLLSIDFRCHILAMATPSLALNRVKKELLELQKATDVRYILYHPSTLECR